MARPLDTLPGAVRLSQPEFDAIRHLLYQVSGIRLSGGKEELVKARIQKRLRALDLSSVSDYLERVRADTSGRELAEMVDLLTTNQTYFFREPGHFELLGAMAREQWASRSQVRVWSAGCSMGHEPYTIAMVLAEYSRTPDVRILGTDISRRVLAQAERARYPVQDVDKVPTQLRHKYLSRVEHDGAVEYQVNQNVRRLVRLAYLNLMGDWPMKGPFQIIFCRNVMIYFDQETRQRLARRFCELLEPGGHLFIGHSESLGTAIETLQCIQPAVYRRTA